MTDAAHTFFLNFLNLDVDQTNIVAAKKSSYFNLTPASSVTSLVDLNDEQHLAEPRPKRRPAKKRALKPKKSLKEKENISAGARLQKSKLLDADTVAPQSKKSLAQSQLLNDLNLFYKNYDQLRAKSVRANQTPFPSLTWTDKFEFFECMRSSEIKYRKNAHYLQRHKSIEAQMRAILIDWLIEISYAYRLHRETLHLAIEYLDRFMSMSQVEMRVDRLQLIGLTSLYLAAKNEEVYPPKMSDFCSHMESYSCDDNEQLMKKFEIAMLKTLEWNISPVTANTWLQTYIQLLCANFKHLVLGTDPSESGPCGTELVVPVTFYKNSDKKSGTINNKVGDFYLDTFMKSIALVDLCLFDLEALEFEYSAVSASALYYVLGARGLAKIELVLERVTGYTLEELDECIKWMRAYFEVCQEMLYAQDLCQVKKFGSIEPSDWHNVQLYHQYLDLLKEAQSRKFKARCEYNVMLTPPESVKKFTTSDCKDASLNSANERICIF
ncbi:G1 S-specific cyclin-E2 isoform X2 [Brachionus plicatilis]|uniref:G1 S-specific cyclin-E2 isoform X2 n=1 Tax=Brachionus plicatilis TaxID=10195 RepID=A0A3M7PC20_BRAPC|nr:G1 S-specific cyclin-E2 isoform X2 [Brachionus plicatilis]